MVSGLRHLLEDRFYGSKHTPRFRYEKYTCHPHHRKPVRASDSPASRLVNEKKSGGLPRGKRNRFGFTRAQKLCELRNHAPFGERLHGDPAGLDRMSELSCSGTIGPEGELGVHRGWDANLTIHTP